MDEENPNMSTLEALTRATVIVGAVVGLSYWYDLNYGKSAEEKWKADSIAEKQYQDSCYKAKNDSIYNATGIYKKREHLKLVPLNLKE